MVPRESNQIQSTSAKGSCLHKLSRTTSKKIMKQIRKYSLRFTAQALKMNYASFTFVDHDG